MNLDHFDIVGIPDMSDDADWLSSITDTLTFDAMMSGNAWVIDIFRSHEYLVLDEIQRIPIRGTDIRKMIQQKQWDEVGNWVIPEVATMLYHRDVAMY